MSFFSKAYLRLLCVLFLSSFVGAVSAQELDRVVVPEQVRQSVPAPLQPWIDWSLRNYEPKTCPRVRGRFQCAWPSSLEFTSLPASSSEQGLSFSYKLELVEAGWTELPGGKVWPVEVTANAKPVEVINSSGDKPTAYFEAGTYAVTGRLLWDQRPENISVPAVFGFGIMDGKAIDVASGKLVLDSKVALKPVAAVATIRNSARLEVFRLLNDDQPFKVSTRLSLSISGAPRQIRIEKANLDGFSVVQLKSELDVKLGTDGALLVKVRPGGWNIDLLATQPQPVTSISLPALSVTLGERDASVEEVLSVDQELWSLQTSPWLRQLQVSGGQALDPSRTNVPRQWHGYPTYLLTKDAQSLSFAVLSRGDKNPKPDELVLSRQFWYDFTGNGWTVADKMSGQISRATRMNAQQKMKLGAVTIAGQPQLVSTLGGADQLGVSVQRGNFSMDAQSRLSTGLQDIPAVGWATNVQRLDASLNLPLGWKSVYISGVDSASDTWVFNWDLLDIFLVLLVFGALLRWVGVVPSLIGLVGLTLVQFDLPALGLTLLAMVVIDAVVVMFLKKASWLRSLFRIGQSALMFGLVIALLMFAVKDVQNAIYPQLSHLRTVDTPMPLGDTLGRDVIQASRNQQTFDLALNDLVSQEVPASEMEAQPSIRMSSQMVSSPKDASGLRKEGFSKVGYYEQKLGQANQTGEGLSAWSTSNSIRLRWDGPVQQGQTFSIIALSPFMNLLVTILKFTCLLLLIVFVALKFGKTGGSLNRAVAKNTDDMKDSPNFGLGRFVRSNLAVVLLATFSILLPFSQSTVFAQADVATFVPEDKTLRDLRAYVLKQIEQPSVCGANCVMLNAISVTQSDRNLSVQVDYSAVEDTVLRLPDVEGWVPTLITRNAKVGESVDLVFANGLGRFVRVDAGKGFIQLSGPFSAKRPISISNPNAVPTWQVAVDDMDASGGKQDKSRRLLTLTPKQITQEEKPNPTEAIDPTDADGAFEAATLETPILVHRTLSAGLRWQVSTTVTRLAGADRAAAVNIPVIDGERVISENVEVKNQIARLNFPVGVKALSWNSELEPSLMLELKANKTGTNGINEVWSISNTSQWHLQSAGVPRTSPPFVRSGSNFNTVQFVNDASTKHFFPWPGESLFLEFEQPEAADGPTFNIDQHKVAYTVGRNLTRATVELRLTSSLGDRHPFTLPVNATNPSLSIDGATQPLVLERKTDEKGVEREVVLMTFAPGAHRINLAWDQVGGLQKSLFGIVGQTVAHDVENLTVNTRISTSVPRDRWLLWAKLNSTSEKPLVAVGPAILIWAYVPVAILLALLLAYLTPVPLRTFSWFLLLIGLSQTAFVASIAVVVFLVAVSFLPKARGYLQNAYIYNLRQLFIAGWAFLTICAFVYAIVNGLLSSPDMKVAGYKSWSHNLSWFIDRWQGETPVIQLITAPVWLFRVLMLAWALWLAFTVLNLSKWFMDQVSLDGFFKKMALPNFTGSKEVEVEDVKTTAKSKKIKET